jgi:hypothetical protein
MAPWPRAERLCPLPIPLLYWPPSPPPLPITGDHQWCPTTASVRSPPHPPAPIKECPGLTSLQHSRSHSSLLLSKSTMPSPPHAFGRNHLSPSLGCLTAARPPVSGASGPPCSTPLPRPLAVGRAPVNSNGQQWRPIHRGLGFRCSTAHGPSPRVFQFKNKPKNQLSREFCKIAPETSKFSIFSTTTPNPVILAPKFSESLLLLFYTFI